MRSQQIFRPITYIVVAGVILFAASLVTFNGVPAFFVYRCIVLKPVHGLAVVHNTHNPRRGVLTFRSVPVLYRYDHDGVVISMQLGNETEPLLYLSARDSRRSIMRLSGPNIMNDGAYCFFRPSARTGLLTAEVVGLEQTVRVISIPFEVRSVGIQMEIDSP
jgi:hypothetical protein